MAKVELSAWILLIGSLVTDVLTLVGPVGVPREHALPRATAGISLVLSAMFGFDFI